MTSASFTEADLLLALRDCYLPLDRRNIVAANRARLRRSRQLPTLRAD